MTAERARVGFHRPVGPLLALDNAAGAVRTGFGRALQAAVTCASSLATHPTVMPISMPKVRNMFWSAALPTRRGYRNIASWSAKSLAGRQDPRQTQARLARF